MSNFTCNSCYYKYTAYLNKIGCEATHIICGVFKKYRLKIKVIEE